MTKLCLLVHCVAEIAEDKDLVEVCSTVLNNVRWPSSNHSFKFPCFYFCINQHAHEKHDYLYHVKISHYTVAQAVSA